MKRLLKKAGALLAATALAACSMGPDYERPEVAIPGAWQGSDVAGPSFARLDWWQVFEDDRLIELIETALRNNYELSIALARIEEARASLGFVRADQFPGLDGTAGAGRGNTIQGAGAPGSINESFVLAASLSFEIDLWGKLRRSTESARATLLATIEARNVVMTTLVADVASVYLLLLDLDQRVAIAERTMVTRQDSLDIIQARFDKGTVPLLDVNQAQIELADAVASLASLERERDQAENALSVLLGQHPGSLARSEMALAETLNIPDIPVGLPSELLERRPDVRGAEQELAAQTAKIGVAEALRFPSLSLTGSLGLASGELDNFISSDNKAWGVSADLLGPIFDAGRGKSRVEAERARTEQLLASYQLTILRAFQEVEDSLVAIHTYKREADAREAQVTAARSATRLSRARYDGGVTSYLEVLESERSLFRAELQALSSRREQVVSIVTLYKALGGGWPTAREIEEAGRFIDAALPPE
ncbi:MAG: efflux transporter outer membrane subunit [Xanthomonadales bacterium]|jgi:multidrug efflux system outer membrane protein|nr:efflux transporter outer membrane subunit [Xanthomonadales bacterium]